MAYTVVSTVVDGDDLVDDWGNDVEAAVSELQATYPELIDTSWTPTLSGITKGNGTEVARFVHQGPIVKCWYHLIFGTTTSVSGDATITNPSGLDAAYPFVGAANFLDASVGMIGAACYYGSATLTRIRASNVAGTYPVVSTTLASNIPFTWVTTDQIIANWEYVAVV